MGCPSIDELKDMLTRGELPVPPGTTWEQVEQMTEFKFGFLLAIAMGIAPARVTVKVVDVGLAGKVGMDVRFDPPLTAQEEPRYEPAIHLVSALLGSRPPVKMASA